MYTIGYISDLLEVPVSTIRYYDKRGLLPNIERNEAGIRQFDAMDIEALSIIECLKQSGMRLDDIKVYMNWCKSGNETLAVRQKFFHDKKKDVEKQIEELHKVLDIVNYKCWYYDEAIAIGDEAPLREVDYDNIPLSVQEAYRNIHKIK